MVSTAGGIVIAVVVILIAAAVGWVVFTQMRARRLGLPPPALSSYIPFLGSSSQYGPPRPAPGGLVGWISDQVSKIKNRGDRSSSGAYEHSSLRPGDGNVGRSHRGFGPLDPDEAWDSRVGHEADSYGYYEEQELGGRGGPAGGADTAYGGGSYHMNVPLGDEENQRGRSPSREPSHGRNPFDDDAGGSLRGVSPRPLDGGAGRGRRDSDDSDDSDDASPEQRRSAFRENV